MQRSVDQGLRAKGGVANGRAINGGRGLSRNGIKRFTTGPQISTDGMDECKGGSCYLTPFYLSLYLSSSRYGIGSTTPFRTFQRFHIFFIRIRNVLDGRQGKYFE